MLRHFASPKTDAVNLHVVPTPKPFDWEHDAPEVWLPDLFRPELDDRLLAKCEAAQRALQHHGERVTTGCLIEMVSAIEAGF